MVLSTIIEIYSLLKECLSGSHKGETSDESVPPAVSTDGGGGTIPFGAILEGHFCVPHSYTNIWPAGSMAQVTGENNTANCEWCAGNKSLHTF